MSAISLVRLKCQIDEAMVDRHERIDVIIQISKALLQTQKRKSTKMGLQAVYIDGDTTRFAADNEGKTLVVILRSLFPDCRRLKYGPAEAGYHAVVVKEYPERRLVVSDDGRTVQLHPQGKCLWQNHQRLARNRHRSLNGSSKRINLQSSGELVHNCES